MTTRQVVVEGGGANLYEIVEAGGRFTAYKVDVKLVWNDRKRLGDSRSLQDALTLIQMHSGRTIKSID